MIFCAWRAVDSSCSLQEASIPGETRLEESRRRAQQGSIPGKPPQCVLQGRSSSAQGQPSASGRAQNSGIRKRRWLEPCHPGAQRGHCEVYYLNKVLPVPNRMLLSCSDEVLEHICRQAIRAGVRIHQWPLLLELPLKMSFLLFLLSFLLLLHLRRHAGLSCTQQPRRLDQEYYSMENKRSYI